MWWLKLGKSPETLLLLIRVEGSFHVSCWWWPCLSPCHEVCLFHDSVPCLTFVGLVNQYKPQTFPTDLSASVCWVPPAWGVKPCTYCCWTAPWLPRGFWTRKLLSHTCSPQSATPPCKSAECMSADCHQKQQWVQKLSQNRQCLPGVLHLHKGPSTKTQSEILLTSRA